MFVAIPVPGVVSAAFEAIRPDLPGLRWGGSAPHHLTLAFLGEVGEPERAALVGELGRIDARPFELRLAGVGCFGGRAGRPLVLWAGVEDRDGRLAELRAGVVDAVRRAGLERDLGGFVPHLTLARGRRLGRPACRPWLERNRGRELGLLPVGEVVLFSSHPGPHGVEHRDVFRHALGGPPGGVRRRGRRG